jgi:hypothetical protein
LLSLPARRHHGFQPGAPNPGLAMPATEVGSLTVHAVQTRTSDLLPALFYPANAEGSAATYLPTRYIAPKFLGILREEVNAP